MKKAKAGRVPVLESAFEIKLPWLMKQAKAMGSNTLVITDGDIRTVVELTSTRLATKLGGQVWLVDIVPVSCLGGRVRPLLKCPRAHEGNFQALYYRAGILACRHCHALRYTTNLASNTIHRIRIKRDRLLRSLGGQPGEILPARPLRRWRKKYNAKATAYAELSGLHYRSLQEMLTK